MIIADAQREVRSVYLGGSVGQAISGLIWLISAALSTWVSTQTGVLALVFGGVFIFPLTQLVLKLLGQKASLSRKNPMQSLAMQVAFIVPLCIPLILGATATTSNWFYAGFMIVVGAHYLPFIFLYGMKHFAVLAALLLGGGVYLGMAQPAALPWTAGGWFTAVVLLVFAVVVWVTAPHKQ